MDMELGPHLWLEARCYLSTQYTAQDEMSRAEFNKFETIKV